MTQAKSLDFLWVWQSYALPLDPSDQVVPMGLAIPRRPLFFPTSASATPSLKSLATDFSFSQRQFLLLQRILFFPGREIFFYSGLFLI